MNNLVDFAGREIDYAKVSNYTLKSAILNFGSSKKLQAVHFLLLTKLGIAAVEYTTQVRKDVFIYILVFLLGF